ncbi:MAG: hypothetical protein HOW73_21760 [Polyangiaceae bacterium]|nr:hypothetical protein [Polyangiaceae bacterium]
MPSLSSLIVQRQVASIAEVEQAIARQVIHGGDLVTNLLEVSPPCEHSLTRVLAESLGIPSVPPGRLPAPDNDVLDIVPVETALRYGIFPLRLSNKTLVIATSERLKPTALHDLAYALGLDISQVAAPLIRIREGIAAHYGVPLEPRQLRLVQKLDALDGFHTRGSGTGTALPTSPSILPSNLSSGVSSPPSALESETPPTRRKGSTLEMEEVRPHPRVQGTLPPPFDSVGDLVPDTIGSPGAMHLSEPPPTAFAEEEPTRDTPIDRISSTNEAPPEPSPVASTAAERPLEPVEEAVAASAAAVSPEELEQPAPRRPSMVIESVTADDDSSVAFAEQEPSSPPSDEPRSFISAPPPADSPRPPTIIDKRAVANLLKREIGSRRRTAAKSARKKGPFSRIDAERELESARSADQVCDTFFAFGSQFFEYAALFVVHGDLVEGRDAWGPGADHLRVLGLGVPLELPSSLAIVRKEAHVLLSRFDELDLDRELLRDLERSRARPPLCAVVPLTLRGRSVAMLFGDDGDADVTLASLGDLLGFSALASAQLERVALAKKGKTGPFQGLVAPRAQPSSVEALARAFSLPMPSGSTFTRALTPSEGTPRALEARVSPGATSVHPPKPVTSSWEQIEEEEVTIAKRHPAAAAAPPVEEVAPQQLEAANAALAETEIPSLAAVQLYAPFLSAERIVAEPPPSEAVVALVHQATALAESAGPDVELPAEPTPAPVAPSVHGPVEPTIEEVTRAREAQLMTPPLATPPPLTTPQNGTSHDTLADHPRHTSRPFVPPIPRVDEDDMSVLVAQHVQEAPLESAPRRYEDESAPMGRAGSYQLVPRPAEVRQRGDSQDLGLLLDHASAGGLEGEEALSELLARADHDFPALMDRFPGPLVVDRLRARADLPPASECGPLLKVIVMMRRAALPFMTVRSTSPDVEQRFWATHVLGELLLPEASNAILPRLFDEDVSVRRVARRAAQALATAGAPGEPLKHSLAHTMRNAEEPTQRRILAIEALADTRVPSVVPMLIPTLVDDSEVISEAVRTALMVLTRQDLGRSPQVWTAWWEMHQYEHRIEWLIQALTHDTASIRRAAGDELKLLTREYFGYYDDLPQKERERAQARYLQWWKDEGQYRFR